MRVLLERPEVGDDQIDAEQLRLREHHAASTRMAVSPQAIDHHVHAELAEAAERDDLERRHVDARRSAGLFVSSIRSVMKIK